MRCVYSLRSEICSQLKIFWKAPTVQAVTCNESLSLDEVFAIEIDSKLYRAKFVFDTTVCQSHFSTVFLNIEIFVCFQTKSVRARLIDTGEIIDIKDDNLHKLPHDIKSMPAAAFLCKIGQVFQSIIFFLSAPALFSFKSFLFFMPFTSLQLDTFLNAFPLNVYRQIGNVRAQSLAACVKGQIFDYQIRKTDENK